MNELDKRVFEFGMDCLEACLGGGKFDRNLWWKELREMGNFDFIHGVEFSMKNIEQFDGLLPIKIRESGEKRL